MALLRALSSNAPLSIRRLPSTHLSHFRPKSPRTPSPLRVFVRFEHTYEDDMARTAHVRRYKLGDLSTRGASFLPNQTARPWERKAGPQAKWIRMLGFWEMTMFGSVIICLFFFAYWVLPFERIFEHTREQTAYARKQFSHLFSGPGFRIRVREVTHRLRNNMRDFADTMGPVQRRTLATHGVGVTVNAAATESHSSSAKKPSTSSAGPAATRNTSDRSPQAVSEATRTSPSHSRGPHSATGREGHVSKSSSQVSIISSSTQAGAKSASVSYSESQSTHHGDTTVTIDSRVFEQAQSRSSRTRPKTEGRSTTSNGAKPPTQHAHAELGGDGIAGEEQGETHDQQPPPVAKSKEVLDAEELVELRRQWDLEKRAFDSQITEAIHQLEMEE